jgi:hypothetical protein
VTTDNISVVVDTLFFEEKKSERGLLILLTLV